MVAIAAMAGSGTTTFTSALFTARNVINSVFLVVVMQTSMMLNLGTLFCAKVMVFCTEVGCLPKT